MRDIDLAGMERHDSFYQSEIAKRERIAQEIEQRIADMPGDELMEIIAKRHPLGEARLVESLRDSSALFVIGREPTPETARLIIGELGEAGRQILIRQNRELLADYFERRCW